MESNTKVHHTMKEQIKCNVAIQRNTVGNTNKWSTATCHHMGGTWKYYAQWEKSTTKGLDLVWFPYFKSSWLYWLTLLPITQWLS